MLAPQKYTKDLSASVLGRTINHEIEDLFGDKVFLDFNAENLESRKTLQNFIYL